MHTKRYYNRTVVRLRAKDVFALDHRHPLSDEVRAELERLAREIYDLTLPFGTRLIQLGPVENLEKEN